MKALERTRILDLSRFTVGTYCTMLLGDVGAEVIKIERPPDGDPYRAGKPSIGNDSAVFLSENRNKKSIMLNLKTNGGREILLKLAKHADVLVENFSPGTMEKLGLGYDVMSKVNPCLIYCSISGFGSDGPSSHLHAYDIVGQTAGGLLSLLTDMKSPMGFLWLC